MGKENVDEMETGVVNPQVDPPADPTTTDTLRILDFFLQSRLRKFFLGVQVIHYTFFTSHRRVPNSPYIHSILPLKRR